MSEKKKEAEMRALALIGCRMICGGMFGNIHRVEDGIDTILMSVWKL